MGAFIALWVTICQHWQFFLALVLLQRAWYFIAELRAERTARIDRDGNILPAYRRLR
jgi:hypothetical protein